MAYVTMEQNNLQSQMKLRTKYYVHGVCKYPVAATVLTEHSHCNKLAAAALDLCRTHEMNSKYDIIMEIISKYIVALRSCNFNYVIDDATVKNGTKPQSVSRSLILFKTYKDNRCY